MKVINLFGRPGVGKSTVASGLFNIMKQKGFNVELVTEFAKDLVWDESSKVLKDQLLVTATQNHRQFRLIGKVDYVITDSPILQGCIYNNNKNSLISNEFIKKLFDSYENVNFLLNRKITSYSKIGRQQNKKEVLKIERELILLLAKYEYYYLNTSEYCHYSILEHLLSNR
jgi:GTPase SAR1 family protein